MHRKTKVLTSNPALVAAALAMLLALASVVAAVNPVQTASATFLGTNGKIAFIISQEGSSDIYSVNPDGSGQARLTNDTAIESQPTWSPDGTKVAFSKTNATGYRQYVLHQETYSTSSIYVMNATDGSGQAKLTNNDAHDRNPSWSPDGSKIAFESDRDGNPEIYVMNRDGSGQTRLTNNDITTGDREADWSPDGAKIIFVTTRDDPPSENFLPRGNSIYTMNANGSGQASLFAGGVSFESKSPHFSPDGTKVVFSGGGFEEGVIVYTINADGTEQDGLTSLAHSPDWSVQPQSTPNQQSILTVNAVSQDDEILHVYAKILSADGNVLQRGFTPMNFTGSLGTEYTVAVADYLAREFDHWEDGSTDRVRTLTIAEDTTITAYYRTG